MADGEKVTIYFESDDLDADCARLSKAGIVFDHQPQDMPWLWREARLRDPDGHLLCLFHAGKNRRHPPWRLELTAVRIFLDRTGMLVRVRREAGT